jgi:hypothetical protein
VIGAYSLLSLFWENRRRRLWDPLAVCLRIRLSVHLSAYPPIFRLMRSSVCLSFCLSV